jgi:hypothetical protein
MSGNKSQTSSAPVHYSTLSYLSSQIRQDQRERELRMDRELSNARKAAEERALKKPALS